MRYTTTLMNDKGARVPTDYDKRVHASLGLAIAHGHKQLDKVNNTKIVAVIREATADRTLGKVIKVIDRAERLTRSPITASIEVSEGIASGLR